MERKRERGAAFAFALCVLAFVTAGAHLWRAGQAGGAAACVFWALLCVRRRAWMRPVSLAALLFFCAEWLVSMHGLVHLRVAMGAPWMRLAVILSGVAAFTGAAGLAAWSGWGRAWFCREGETARMQAAAFALAALPLLFVAQKVPYVLLAERLIPSAGVLQAFAAGAWAAWACGRLAQRRTAFRTRMMAWRLFSAVFFLQFALAAAGWGLFAMTGELHLPVPGVIVAGALYRGSLSFMPLLFVVSALMAGAAWCSHLCYFGSWDAWAASFSRPSPHPGPMRWRVLSLVAVAAGALLLTRLPADAAVACGAALGLVMLPVAAFASRRKGYAAYCTLVCPLGLLACALGRLSPWRIRKTPSCTGCGACASACRYGALRASAPKMAPGASCTLCRACLHVCSRGGLAVSFWGRGAQGMAESALVTLLSAMHALFLFSAMV